MPTEKRRAPRARVTKKAQVTYVDDQGRDRFEVITAQDVSTTGCRVLLTFRCQPRTVVTINFSGGNSGSASVRYQNPTPRGYSTGLEFLGGMRLPSEPAG